MKPAALAAALLAAALLLGACAQSPADAYADFLSDADLLMRFSICFDDIEKGRDTFYTDGELRELERDLEAGYAVDDEAARDATCLFQESARRLRGYLGAEDRDAAEYEAAKACFDAATRRADQVRAA